jgi:hypothetical protein
VLLKNLGGHATRDIGGWGADGHADADFTVALQDGVVKHTVETDAGEQGLARSKLDETPCIGRGMGGFGRHFALPLCYL